MVVEVMRSATSAAVRIWRVRSSTRSSSERYRVDSSSAMWLKDCASRPISSFECATARCVKSPSENLLVISARSARGRKTRRAPKVSTRPMAANDSRMIAIVNGTRLVSDPNTRCSAIWYRMPECRLSEPEHLAEVTRAVCSAELHRGRGCSRHPPSCCRAAPRSARSALATAPAASSHWCRDPCRSACRLRSRKALLRPRRRWPGCAGCSPARRSR